MAEQLRVFVSHSHQDNAFCHAIVAALREAGADVWYDEHNLGWGELHEVIQRELGRRAIFVLILSKHAFASPWVKRETSWAYKLYNRDPTRVILPVTAGSIEATDFDPEAGWLFLDDFKRIEAPGLRAYPVEEAANHLLRALALTSGGERFTTFSRWHVTVSPPTEDVYGLLTPSKTMHTQKQNAEDLTPSERAPQPAEDVDDLLTRGKAMIAQDKYAEALPLCLRATQLAPSSLDAWVSLGATFGALGRYHEALAAFDHALALDPNDAFTWNNRALALLGLRSYDDADAAVGRALTLSQEAGDIWHTRGQILNAKGRYENALILIDHAIRLEPQALGKVWHSRAVALRGLGRMAEAEVAERRASELGWGE